ncbi:MAG: hydrogenase maturation protein [Sedimentitalea sp.]|nr:hydrogenase maturation protein [Sedimentitalea sp.]
MRILLQVHGFNSLSQRLFVELQSDGHEVSVEFDINDAVLTEAIDLFNPDVVLAPFLKRAIPARIWKDRLCLIVHPGIVGDRGPSALDWAILRNEATWGVTVLQAEEEMDAGPIWAHAEFPMRAAGKSSLYRREVTNAALAAVREALDNLATPGFEPRPLYYAQPEIRGRLQPAMRQPDRQIDWEADGTEEVLRKIRSADGVPGVRDEIAGADVFLHDARPAPGLKGSAGAIIATSGPAIARATRDGAVWIGHLRAPRSDTPFKLPATQVLQGRLPDVPKIDTDTVTGYREISYRDDGKVGYLGFDFYNGAMSVTQCERLLAAYRAALARPTKVIVLEGGEDFWSNGIHLNTIEAAESAAEESWRNINAIDDLAEAIIRTESHLTVAAMRGNSGAGGVFLARACDRVWLHDAVVLNPHYKDMGNLFGSEFWTYLLPRHCGSENARRIAQQRLPMGAAEAVALGLADSSLGADKTAFEGRLAREAAKLALNFDESLAAKVARRRAHEKEKPLSAYRDEELRKMRRNFFGFDTSYHVARYNFVHKICKSRTPVTLAMHRNKTCQPTMRNAS